MILLSFVHFENRPIMAVPFFSIPAKYGTPFSLRDETTRGRFSKQRIEKLWPKADALWQLIHERYCERYKISMTSFTRDGSLWAW